MSAPVRLHVKGTVLGYQRSREAQRPNRVLVRLPQVSSKDDARFYLGKRVAYYYKAQSKKHGSKLRVVWGKVTGVHGNSGVVRARFAKNLSPDSFAQTVRVFMWPSNL
ncbi:60S ribosomal protein L35a [Gregarina niphandrodes]|uniref:60S ribosomal protein L35a n=1 Tax=Gregarina niphandrodes TaxID=110365 RepID=A0A023AXZ5_GRENI|nr:60S ribosomal protein L35a [Gregarina niphandrodes]EZG43328.1 60S ribosomal protein L35a [Gregarina niphandrodes]|eukprot:XP_011133414.1 60S ribosomal protein L35a [Gregarina niphandrodes]